jgi:hypothetical protein
VDDVTAKSSEALPKVLFVAGWGRSGSTVLDQTLGEIDGWFSSGELSYVWHDHQCGCGASVHACEFWSPLLRDMLGDVSSGSQEMIAVLGRELSGLRRVAAISAESRRRASGHAPRMRYPEVATELYRRIRAATAARVVVDSSKQAIEAYALGMLTDVDLFVVHLVRDPRATAHAWGKTKVKTYEPLRYFSRFGPAKSSLYWLRRNALVDTLVRRQAGSRYLLLRYEDFVAAPQSAVRSICRMVGEPDADLSFISGSTVRVSPNHTVAGNPSRFSGGRLLLRRDDEWRSAMGIRSKVVSTLVAAPLLHRYGYPVRPG